MFNTISVPLHLKLPLTEGKTIMSILRIEKLRSTCPRSHNQELPYQVLNSWLTPKPVSLLCGGTVFSALTCSRRRSYTCAWVSNTMWTQWGFCSFQEHIKLEREVSGQVREKLEGKGLGLSHQNLTHLHQVLKTTFKKHLRTKYSMCYSSISSIYTA